MITHKGFQIALASDRGGKAGKGCNKTSTVQVRWPCNGGYTVEKQIRFRVGDDASLKKAVTKALQFADDRSGGRERDAARTLPAVKYRE